MLSTINDARIRQEEVEGLTLDLLGSFLETKDIKMTVRFKSLKALRNMNERLSHFHDEYFTECDSNFTIHLLIRNFTQRVTVNIPRGKNMKSQVQGLKRMEDMRLVIARFGQIGLHVMEKPQLSAMICTIPMPLLHNLDIPHDVVIVNNQILKRGHAKLCFTAGNIVTMIGREWDDIKYWIEFLGKHIVLFGEPPLFAGQLGLDNDFLEIA